MDEISKEKLIRKRATSKAVLTSHEKFMLNFELNNAEDYETLCFRHSKLKEALIKFDEAQDQLDELEADDCNERDEFYTKYGKALSRVNVLLKSKSHLQASSPVADSNAPGNGNSTQFEPQLNIKLPDIQIPTFSGQFSNWLQFRDTFKAIVIDRPELSNVAKFYYLNSSITGEPKKLIQNLQPSDINFAVAWELLERRYDNVRLIANSHVRNLFNPPVLQRGSATSLRGIIDHFSSNVNALRALELNDVSIQDLILSQMIINLLDSATIKDWETLTNSSEVPALSDLIDFLEKRCKILEALNLNGGNDSQRATFKSQPQASLSNINYSNQCPLCKGPHYLYACERFRNMSVEDRWSCVKGNKLCYNCLRGLGRNHVCSARKCVHCQKAHHTFLHQSKPTQTPVTTRSTSDLRGSNLNAQVSIACTTPSVEVAPPSRSCAPPRNTKELLPTARVRVRDASGKFVTCTALLDSGSDCNLATVRLIERLRVPTYVSQTIIDGVSGQCSTSARATELEISSCHTSWHSTVSVVLVDKVSGDLPTTQIDASGWEIPPNLTYADGNCFTPKPIELLLGSNVFFQVLCGGKFTSTTDAPTIQNTLLGWIFAGNVPVDHSLVGTRHIHSAAIISRNRIHSQLERFWQIEEVNTRLPTSEELACEEHFVKNTTRNEDGRYVVRLPRKADADQLGQSRGVSFRRFQALERRLAREPELREAYVDFMSEYEDLGHMEPVLPSDQTSSDECYHIPHHPVMKPSSTTTKVRAVFDASAPSTTGKSLNDTLMVGPVLQQDLFNITLRFRTHPVAFTSDISKMYRQILIHPDDCDLQRILWRVSPSEPLMEYRLRTVTYGTAAASFLATRALRQLVLDDGERYPQASPIVSSDFYVDDCISGCETHEQAVIIYHELNSLLALGGFQLRKWSTNSSHLLNAIPDSDRETQSLRGFGDNSECVVKTLGLLWQPEEDKFYIQSPPLPDMSQIRFTKRILLSTIASIFDPLGLVAPVVITCKMLFQSLWAANLGWDDDLPPHIHDSWCNIYRSLSDIAHISVPRFVGTTVPTQIQLHGFCDSSEQAFGACFYLLSCDASGHKITNLLCAKSRVAPAKRLSIPKLELCAAVLLTKLLIKVQSSLRLNISSVTLWSDSNIVLAWIAASPQRWKTFVANRVAEIQNHTSGCSWKHVASRDNPADLISRGVSPADLKFNSLWWNGPSWLSNSSLLEQSGTSIPNADEMPERKICNVTVTTTNFDSYLLQRYSLYPAILRIVALCKRFAHNCRSTSRVTGPLTALEIDDALITAVKIIQSQHFSTEISALTNQQPLPSKSSLVDLHPFLHSDGTLRVGGRLQNSQLPFDSRHQLILPGNHFARKLIRHTHFRLLHGGINLIIADVRQRFWIPGIRRLVRSVVRSCMTCFRFSARPAEQIMGQLPAVRVQPAHPFLNVGVDYAGPIIIRFGGPRSKVTTKAYIAIFICMATKAVHIEVVTSLSTAAFIAAFSRFYCRRGIPSLVYSDNGSNFQGAQRELSEIATLLTSPTFQQYVSDAASKLLIQWHFIPPRAPHFGGLWEANVKSLKHHLRRVTFGQLLSYEEFSTIVIQIEAVMNSRPIAPLSEDPSDLNYLSPGHFLIGRSLTTLPVPDLVDVPINRLSRWQHLQRIMLSLWRKWAADYLQTLQRRSKWRTERPDLRINTLVLIKDDEAPPLHWRLGIVVETHPGPDGRVRVVTLRTARGHVKRAINRICPLPVDSACRSSDGDDDPKPM